MSQIDLLETFEIIAFSQLPAGIWLYWLVMLPRSAELRMHHVLAVKDTATSSKSTR